jgi:hypothetical protein
VCERCFCLTNKPIKVFLVEHRTHRASFLHTSIYPHCNCYCIWSLSFGSVQFSVTTGSRMLCNWRSCSFHDLFHRFIGVLACGTTLSRQWRQPTRKMNSFNGSRVRALDLFGFPLLPRSGSTSWRRSRTTEPLPLWI